MVASWKLFGAETILKNVVVICEDVVVLCEEEWSADNIFYSWINLKIWNVVYFFLSIFGVENALRLNEIVVSGF